MYFFIFILFLFIILIFFFPNYIKKDIVPPLSSNNYHVKHDSVGSVNVSSIKDSTFSDLIIKDGEGSGTDAVDFGGVGGDETAVSYIPYHGEMTKKIYGFFDLNIASNIANTYLFRVVDTSQGTIGNDLDSYNKGWATLNTLAPVSNTLPLYNLRVPFVVPALTNNQHSLTVQISARVAPGNGTSIQLSSAYLFYQSYDQI